MAYSKIPVISPGLIQLRKGFFLLASEKYFDKEVFFSQCTLASCK